MVEVRWTDQAISDIESIAEYIAKDSVKYAGLQVHKIFAAEIPLVSHPQSGRIVPEINQKSIREIIVEPYRIIYRILNKERIDVLTVHHSKKRFVISQVKKIR